jgi:hypothetical protein
MSNGRLAATGVHFHAIADQMRKSKPARDGKADLAACPGVEGFTKEDWKDLDVLEKRVDEQVAKAMAPKASIVTK